MAVSLERGSGTVVLERCQLRVEIRLEPFSVRVSRRGIDLFDGITLFTQPGEGEDRFIQLTEGVIPEERRGEPTPIGDARVIEAGEAGLELDAETAEGTVRIGVRLVGSDHVGLLLHPASTTFRIGAAWGARPGEHLTGLGARHCETVDQRGRVVGLGADSRYTGPDCPADMLAEGGIPQGDYVPAPWLVSSAGWSAWVETWGPGLELDLLEGVSISQRAAAGPLRLHLLCSPTPLARLRHYLRLTGFPGVLPEWAYGHWKSRDVYEHERDVIEDLEGYLEHSIPLDAIVIDSPWETQYNTWRFNPHQFPDAAGLVHDMREDGVRTVVWVTPWVNLESIDGQRPPDRESERIHAEPAENYADGAEAGHYVRAADGEPYVGRWWMGTGSIVDFTSRAARAWWRELSRNVFELGVEGVKADDGEGYYFPSEAQLADGRTGAEAAWEYGRLYREATQDALDAVHGEGRGVIFGRSGWTGQQATGMLWGGDQTSDFWSLRALLVSLMTAAATGFSNLSHDVGGYLGRRLAERCDPELLIRWAQ